MGINKELTLVERLELTAKEFDDGTRQWYVAPPVLREAAKEIERLRKALDQAIDASDLRTAIEADGHLGVWEWQSAEFHEIEGPFDDYVAAGERSSTYLTHAPELASVLRQQGEDAR